MKNNVGLFLVNFTNFYAELNDLGRLVFIIVVLLFVILIVLIFIMIFQKTMTDRQLKLIYEDDQILDKVEEELEKSNVKVEDNDKTRRLKNIVEELEKASTKAEVSDVYEDEQEKTAIISYKELLKAARGEEPEKPVVSKIEPVIEKPKKQEVFSSVFTPNQKQVIKEKSEEKTFTDNENFLNSLKEFRNNL